MNKPQATTQHKAHWKIWVTGLVLFCVFIYLIRDVLMPFVVGLLIAYFLDPAVRKLHRRGLSREASASIITIVFFVVAGNAIALLVPLVLDQLASLSEQVPSYVQMLEARFGQDVKHYLANLSVSQLDSVKTAATNLGGSFAEMISNTLPGMLRSSLAIGNVLLLVFLTPIVTYYLLRDWEVFVKQVDEMLPRQYAPVIREQLSEIDASLSGFIRGQTNVCLVMAAFYGIGLTLVGLKSGLGLGILCGLMLFIPYIGFAASFIACLSIALFQFGWETQTMMLLGVFGIGMLLENGFVVPKLIGDKLGLHPIWIIFGFLAGGTVLGILGILLSLPVTAVVSVLVRFAMKSYQQSALYSGE